MKNKLRGESCVGVGGKSIPGRICKDPTVRKCLVCLQNSREARVAGAEQAGMEVGKVVREATRKQGPRDQHRILAFTLRKMELIVGF